MKLMETWVKTPRLKENHLLIASECLKYINPKLWKDLKKGKTVLTYCPENETVTSYGKIASMIRSSSPKSITVVTIDGSPHCFLLHAAINEAEYILGEKINREHYVLVDGKDLVKIDPNVVRLARYLSILNKFANSNKEVLEELERHSLEYQRAKKLNSKVH
ncbi:MAG: 4Fe-4S ferredoxin [Thermoproteota archaeon]